jgi:hypothetical protein
MPWLILALFLHKQQTDYYNNAMAIINNWSNILRMPQIHALAPILPVLLLWEGFWKGLALWHSGRRGQAWWFVIILVVNTIGILPIIYLFAVAKLKLSELFSKKV